MSDEKKPGRSFLSLITHHLSLFPQPVKLPLKLLRVAARVAGVFAAALRRLEVLERGDQLGPLERVEVLALDVAEAEVVVRVGASARRGGLELRERRAAVRRPKLDAAPVVFGGRGRGRARGCRRRRRLRRGRGLRRGRLLPGRRRGRGDLAL